MWIETPRLASVCASITVTPHAGVWIETLSEIQFVKYKDVTPHAGVWIETPSVGTIKPHT